MNSNASATALRALKILEILAAGGRPLSVLEVASAIAADRSTAYRMLMTLHDAGYVVRDASAKNYYLGYKLVTLAGPLLSGESEAERILDRLRRLADETRETVHYCVLDRDATVLLYKAKGTQLVSVDFNVGDRAPLHCTSIGKALLAYQGAQAVEQIISLGLPRVAVNTIVDPARFRAELHVVRRQGFALDDLEFHDDMRCVAVPVFEADGSVRAGISLSGPSSRYTLQKLDELKDHALAASRELSRSWPLASP